MKVNINKIYKKIAARKILIPINKLLFKLSLRGLGILNYEDSQISGEDFFLEQFFQIIKPTIALDIGANIGKYSTKIKSLSPNTQVYAFEPHPKSFEQLKLEASQHGYIPINMGCSDSECSLKLYDYQNTSDDYPHSHASLYKNVIEEIHHQESISWDIEVTTIDRFCLNNNISHINLLKIDTEGNEFKILLGAKGMLDNNSIDCIHFEFNEMNIASRVFFKDFYDFLHNQYHFYRMLTDGLFKLDQYHPLTYEIFAYQNIVAIRKDLEIKFQDLIG